jgi:hypothetical protein
MEHISSALQTEPAPTGILGVEMLPGERIVVVAEKSQAYVYLFSTVWMIACLTAVVGFLMLVAPRPLDTFAVFFSFVLGGVGLYPLITQYANRNKYRLVITNKRMIRCSIGRNGVPQVTLASLPDLPSPSPPGGLRVNAAILRKSSFGEKLGYANLSISLDSGKTVWVGGLKNAERIRAALMGPSSVT